jgi:hypothetical protein
MLYRTSSGFVVYHSINAVHSILQYQRYGPHQRPSCEALELRANLLCETVFCFFLTTAEWVVTSISLSVIAVVLKEGNVGSSNLRVTLT